VHVGFDFAHQGRAAGGNAIGNLDCATLTVLPFPVASERFHGVERFLPVRLSECGEGSDQRQN
jgi:hypothetical protein